MLSGPGCDIRVNGMAQPPFKPANFEGHSTIRSPHSTCSGFAPALPGSSSHPGQLTSWLTLPRSFPHPPLIHHSHSPLPFKSIFLPGTGPIFTHQIKLLYFLWPARYARKSYRLTSFSQSTNHPSHIPSCCWFHSFGTRNMPCRLSFIARRRRKILWVLHS